MLHANNGYYTRYVTVNSLSGQVITGVSTIIQKAINGTPTTIATGTTDGVGMVIFWLDPDDLHTFTFTKID
ncbi:hypothetical protein LCGC14_2087820, partial [marine sediment metagenome]